MEGSTQHRHLATLGFHKANVLCIVLELRCSFPVCHWLNMAFGRTKHSSAYGQAHDMHFL